MTDESSDQPQALTSADLEAFIKQINEANEKRFQGFQGLMDRRDEAFRQALEDLKTDQLDPEDREAAREKKLTEELEALRRKNEVLSMRKTHPEEADLLEQFLAAGSLEDQIELLSKFRKAEAPATPGPDEGEAAEGGKPTPVDQNNPPRKGQPDLSSAAQGMTKELADQLLASQGNDKGILARLRKIG